VRGGRGNDRATRRFVATTITARMRHPPSDQCLVIIRRETELEVDLEEALVTLKIIRASDEGPIRVSISRDRC
jgi:hypothetical protein